MKRFYFIGFMVLMVFDTITQISIKYAGDQALPFELSTNWLGRLFGQPWIYGAVVGYIGAFFTWITLLKRAPIGPAFAASHLEIISVLVLSSLLFNENIGWAKIVGCGLILLGILLLAISETSESEKKKDKNNGYTTKAEGM
ncbi:MULTISPECIES: EamA family transporter [Serratia]|uniref:EamA family transporter n=2 Tax=Serratia TaxID=613 RepID=A0AAW6X5A8_9GAMM|nr:MULTISPECIES: EamA family transporter [Serratia]AKL40602.1 membrane protein [Serratia marcescens]AUY13803.1 EamA family transporter [Serratia sp. SSNIH1]AVU34160.1 EamA family transporter [Serratia marcescens]AVU39263.1 EamA family transporter [Serratia marcescens]AWL67861.1 EamA family transporter [Serratia marcescens]